MHCRTQTTPLRLFTNGLAWRRRNVLIPSVSQRADEPFLPMFFAADVESDWKTRSPIRFKDEFKGKPYEDKGVLLKVKPVRRLKP